MHRCRNCVIIIYYVCRHICTNCMWTTHNWYWHWLQTGRFTTDTLSSDQTTSDWLFSTRQSHSCLREESKSLRRKVHLTLLDLDNQCLSWWFSPWKKIKESFKTLAENREIDHKLPELKGWNPPVKNFVCSAHSLCNCRQFGAECRCRHCR